MNSEIYLLCLTAASLGLVHTVLGPDHYVPFVVMAKARHWSLSRTLWLTFGCGVGHILSSVFLGLIGVALGAALVRLQFIESIRGNIAAWALMAFGFLYFAWGIKRAYRRRSHEHFHHHSGSAHLHRHSHLDEHVHVHESREFSMTPWVLFVVFVLGPCEPLIPLLMYPAAQHSYSGLLWVTAIFGITTIVTMLVVVAASVYGLSFVRVGRMERFSHALAGLAIFLSGIAIQLLGL